MNYWLNLFTGTTWREFQAAGSKVSGFRDHTWNRAKNLKVGDIFLCYLVGVKRWVGLLEITDERFRDESPIFAEEIFPVRFRVTPLVMLPPEHGVPMSNLKGKLTFYPPDMQGAQWSGHVRSSLTRYAEQDGEVIAKAIRDAQRNPVFLKVDERQLKRSANLYKAKLKVGDQEIERVVSIPRSDEDEEERSNETEAPDRPTHSQIQWRLLDLGSQMGLDVWCPRRDRNRSWNDKAIGTVPRMRDRLPTQFDENTNRTIEEIDVIWFNGQSIVAAFEVEHTTSIFSGLLRMADLLTMQPNLDIKLYLVGPMTDMRVSSLRLPGRRLPLAPSRFTRSAGSWHIQNYVSGWKRRKT